MGIAVFRPAYSQSASGTLGNIIFDKRGYIRTRPKKSDKPQSAAQGNVQQSFAAARKAVKIAASTVQHAIKTHKDIKAKKKKQGKYFQPGFWATYLASEMLGIKRSTFINNRQRFNHLTLNEQLLWDKAGQVVGLQQFEVAHASEAAISAGLQLYWLANTLHQLNIYPQLGIPTTNNALTWAAHITATDTTQLTQKITQLTTYPSLTPQPINSTKPQPTTTQTNPSQQPSATQHQPNSQLLITSYPQTNSLPTTNIPYHNNQLAQGNHLPNHLPQYILPNQYNNNHLSPQTPTIPLQSILPYQLPQSPTPNPHSPSPIPQPQSPIYHLQLTQATDSQSALSNPQTPTNWPQLIKQLTAFILTILLPSILTLKKTHHPIPPYTINITTQTPQVTHTTNPSIREIRVLTLLRSFQFNH